MNTRTETVIGKNNQNKLKNSTIAILGLGGVGGFVTEMFARLGVGSLVLVDFDTIDKTNLNRQVIALKTNLGKFKTDEFKKRIKNINPLCKVKVFKQKIDKNIDKILSEKIDFVVDAVDDIKAKVEIIKFCKEKKLSLVCSMGAGYRSGIPKFEVCDIFDTCYDGLAKYLRKELKKLNISNVNVVFTKEPAKKTQTPGSVVYYPLMCAGVIVSFVSNEIFKKK